MKKNYIIVISAIVLAVVAAFSCYAQSGTEQGSKETNDRQEQLKSQRVLVYEQNQVDQPAAFVGGVEKMMEFMLKNVKYPKEAEKDGASGVVRVHFIVDTDGSLIDVNVPDSVHFALDAEGIRLVKAMPKWTPAKIEGKAVRQKALVAIPFRLN